MSKNNQSANVFYTFGPRICVANTAAPKPESEQYISIEVGKGIIFGSIPILGWLGELAEGISPDWKNKSSPLDAVMDALNGIMQSIKETFSQGSAAYAAHLQEKPQTKNTGGVSLGVTPHIPNMVQVKSVEQGAASKKPQPKKQAPK